MDKITVTGGNGDYNAITIRHSRFGVQTFTLARQPTHNCQLFVLGGANQLKFITDKEMMLRLLIGLYSATSRPLMLTDISWSSLKGVKLALKDYTDIKIESPYHSTSGSKMTLVLFKLKMAVIKKELAVIEQNKLDLIVAENKRKAEELNKKKLAAEAKSETNQPKPETQEKSFAQTERERRSAAAKRGWVTRRAGQFKPYGQI
jgi:hypothetical protein